MRHRLAVTLILSQILAFASTGARTRPPAPICRGCDCLQEECLTPCCDCTLPPDSGWCERMLGSIQARLVGGLGERMRVPQPIRIRLVDPMQLAAYGAGDGMDGVQGLYDDGLIVINSALTRRDAVAVLAHEYGHAWQFSHHPKVDEVDGALREGFAEWVALQALKRFGAGSGGDILRRNRDPVYGGGLRWFLEVEANFGREVVFEQATTWLDTQGRRVPPPPPPKPKPKEKTPDDESVPDDMSESSDGSGDRPTPSP